MLIQSHRGSHVLHKHGLCRSSICLLGASAALLVSIANADVVLHGLFTDNMVLQRGGPVSVYGTADEGEEVTVEIDGHQVTGTARDGQWLVQLPAMSAGGPHRMTVAGKNTVVLENVLVGDVWICTGQSNMAGVLSTYIGPGYKDYADLYAGIPDEAPLEMVRLFKQAKGAADSPQIEVKPDGGFGASWRVCDAESAPAFSCTGYLFGRALQPRVKVPIGLIYAAVGGTPAESWVSPDVISGNAELSGITERFAQAVENYPKAMEAHEKRVADWQAKRKAKQKVGRRPRAPMGPTHIKRPSGLFHQMIAPLQSFQIKGAIWYQGESNARRPEEYRTLFPALITSWREQWGIGDFPFLFVQLAAFRQIHPTPRDAQWPWLREAQTEALKLANTGMAVAIEAGHQTNIHPPQKPTVAERLALAALDVAYGQDVVSQGPTFRKMALRGAKAVIAFDHVGDGLVAEGVSLDGHELPAGELRGFAVCGEDGRFKWASATIEGDTVVLSHPEVNTPVAVRYAWDEFPLCNLYSKAGLPTPPFRTDSFERGAASRVTGIAVGKPVTCDQPINHPRGFYNGLTDGSTVDTNQHAFATNASRNFPKTITVDLQGTFAVNTIRVHNSALGGTKRVSIQTSAGGEAFTTVGETEFKNYTADVHELKGLTRKGITHVRLVAEDVHEISFQRKPNGFIFLRELEVHGTPK